MEQFENQGEESRQDSSIEDSPTPDVQPQESQPEENNMQAEESPVHDEQEDISINESANETQVVSGNSIPKRNEHDSDEDIVDVTWTMSDTTGVIDYYVAVSDSNVFDYGEEKKGFFTNLVSLTQPFAFANEAFTHVPADVDSLILYFNVSAVYKNEIFNGFIGPRAVKPGLTYGDSALVYRK